MQIVLLTRESRRDENTDMHLTRFVKFHIYYTHTRADLYSVKPNKN